jgi:hypothetical protein
MRRYQGQQVDQNEKSAGVAEELSDLAIAV